MRRECASFSAQSHGSTLADRSLRSLPSLLFFRLVSSLTLSTHWIVPLTKNVEKIDTEARERQLREGVTTDGQHIGPVSGGSSDIEKGNLKHEEATHVEDASVTYRT